MPSESSVIAATAKPLPRGRLVADLHALGVEPGSLVIVHASLSSLGWVIGGAQTVVESLLEAVGPNGTVVMPAQSSQLGDPANWGNPPVPVEWQAAIREQMPAYDPALTPTRGLGAVAECFLCHARCDRSPHPLASFAAVGRLARKIVEDHPLSPALGETSPLGRLYELDADVLLIGVGHEHNTSLHLAEHRASWPGKVTAGEGAPIKRNGKREWVAYEDLVLDDEDFAAIGEAFAATGSERTGRVGQAECRLASQRALVDFAAGWISANRG